MTIAKQKIKWQEILLTIAFITFYLPASYAVPGMIYKLWKAAFLFVSLCACALLVFRKNIRFSIRYAIFVLFYAWIYLGTGILTDTGNVAKTNFIRCFGFITLFEVSFYLCSKKTIAKSFLTAGLIMSLIHFLSFIRYSGLDGGMRHGQIYVVAGRIMKNSTQNWYFLTYDNDSIFYFIPVAALLLYYYHNYSKSALKLFVFYLGFILYMFISKTAATAMVSMLLFTLLVVYYLKCYEGDSLKKVPKLKLNYRLAILIGVVFSIIMVSIVGGGVATAIGNYFGKDGSFSGRDKIWAKAIKYFLENPIVGYGIEPAEQVWDKIGQTHCHNIFIELLYTGGIIALVLFAAVLYLYRPKKTNTFSSYIFASAMLCYLITAGIDFLYTNPIPMSLLYFTHYFTEEKYLIKKGVI